MFEIGDTVVIADAEYLVAHQDEHPHVVSSMLAYAGTECTITRREVNAANSKTYVYRVNSNKYRWLEDWLMPIASYPEVSEKSFEELLSI